MAVAVEDVPHWLILDGNIGHVLVMRKHGWHYTACRNYTPGGVVTEEAPERICRKCRSALKQATLRKNES